MAPSGKFWTAMPMDRASALRDIVEGDGQHQHGGPFQPHIGPFRPAAALVQMGDHPVQRQQEQDPQPEPGHSRGKGPPAHVLRLLHGRDQQAPDGGRHHHPGGKPGQGPLNLGMERTAHDKNAG